ncbi:protein kinase domain-containing protein, partial [Parapedobacter pyrenivorans]|uniref:protein kinase domain-containing protein n=1 Tax=Parapedobacter pyrenivorans TaxID=1305674 RepID=UPI003DA74358
MKPTSPCPSFEMLCSWVAGKLDDTASEEVGLHLEFCTACESMVTRIERERPDTIAQQMKGLGTLSRSLKVPDLQIENEVDNPADEIDLPDSIDSYKIVRILGHGGMGVVYEVEHPLLKRHDAIKLVKPKHRLRPEMQERLRREMEAVSRLEHTNIVRAYS